MTYQLPTDANQIRFFGKKTADGAGAFMPIVIYAADGVTPLSVLSVKDIDVKAEVALVKAELQTIKALLNSYIE